TARPARDRSRSDRGRGRRGRGRGGSPPGVGRSARRSLRRVARVGPWCTARIATRGPAARPLAAVPTRPAARARVAGRWRVASPVNAELFSVGCDEAVITFTTADADRVVTRVGDDELATTGPRHVVRIAGLQPDSPYTVAIEGVAGSEALPSEL